MIREGHVLIFDQVLVSGVMDRLEPAFKSMNGTNWGGVTAVGEESAHIHQWHSSLQEAVPRIRDNALSPSYFKTFCAKLVTDFLDKYVFFPRTQVRYFGARCINT